MLFRRNSQASPSMTLEGPLGPNDRLEQASGFRVEEPSALCLGADNRLFLAAGASVLSFRKWGAPPQNWAEFELPVTALFASPGGIFAVGLLGGGLRLCDPSGNPLGGWRLPLDLTSATDGLFLSENEFVVVDHGYRRDEPILSLAPWDDVGRGKIVSVRRDGEPRILAGGLWCPMGVSEDSRGDLIVTEFERARIVDVSGTVRQSGYPGYLGRLRKIRDRYLMTCMARRDPLIEFLKSERRFVDEMKATIEPKRWIAPRVSPEFAHDFPIELGATRLFGEVKPWAPSFSYGLVIELNDALMPVGSAHSRANGRRHAISDALVWNGDLIAVSKASGELLNLGCSGGGA